METEQEAMDSRDSIRATPPRGAAAALPRLLAASGSAFASPRLACETRPHTDGRSPAMWPAARSAAARHAPREAPSEAPSEAPREAPDGSPCGTAGRASVLDRLTLPALSPGPRA